jgi:CTP-dependent riboflavin kinase
MVGESHKKLLWGTMVCNLGYGRFYSSLVLKVAFLREAGGLGTIPKAGTMSLELEASLLSRKGDRGSIPLWGENTK